MNADLKQLYRELGYTGTLPETITFRGPTTSEEEKLPLLNDQTLTQVEKLINTESQQTISTVREGAYERLTEEEIRSSITEARRAFEQPDAYIAKLQAEREAKNQKNQLPEGSTGQQENVLDALLKKFRQYPDVVVEPGNTKFEPKNDALGWLVNSGVFWLRDKLKISVDKAPFPFHDNYESNFTYAFKDKDGRQLDGDAEIAIALFADWGTGLYHSEFIARHMAELRPHYAIHLGDVYYSGRNSEFKLNFQQPLEPLLETSQVFAMNGNHEMYSGGYPYLAHLNDKHKTRIGHILQDQQGSYFCLWNEKYQVIAIDTAYHEDGRHKNPSLQQWLGERLWEGKRANPKRTNVLLSPNEPYELGREQPLALLQDLGGFVEAGLIDFWFWGNTHYGALFDRSDKTPYIGSCVGHGGHPIYRQDIVKAHDKHEDLLSQQKPVAPALWVELTPKFPEATTHLRPELGNHGFCLMHLRKDSIRLTYYDWLKDQRFTQEFPT